MKTNPLYLIISAILYAIMGVYLIVQKFPTSKIIKPIFFILFGSVLILLAITRAIKVYYFYKKK